MSFDNTSGGVRAPDMKQIPRRVLLSDQVASVLREGMETARWVGRLPSEAELCRELQVSRVTLRRALDQLVRERRVESGGRGRHHKISTKRVAGPAEAGRTVRVLAPYPLAALGSVSHAVLVELTERIAAMGYRLEFEHRPMVFKRHMPEELERLDSLPDTAAWLLLYSTEPMQRWFEARSRACVALGRVHEGVALPCVYPDSRASARHAAGMFFRRGYRDCVYLMAKFTSLGDRLASEVFVEETRRLGGRARVLEYEPTVEAIRALVEGLIAERAPLAGFYASCPEDCLSVLCVLLGARVRVPETVALISGWDDHFLHHAVPSVACYRADGVELGRKLAQLLADLLLHGPGKARHLRVLPKFVPGGTLGAA